MQNPCFDKNIEDHKNLDILIKKTPCRRNHKHETAFYKQQTISQIWKVFHTDSKEKQKFTMFLVFYT